MFTKKTTKSKRMAVHYGDREVLVLFLCLNGVAWLWKLKAQVFGDDTTTIT